jgi:two component transcriptional regulator, winged helix family
MYKIFLIEDDESLAKLIKSGLERFGYEVFVAEDFFNIIPQYKNIMPHLVLIDVNLPFFNGYHWCSQIRKFSKVPIIFISSVTERMNIIMALNMGDDDYITKPFDFDVLETKILALLRRTYDFQTENEYIEYKELILDLASMKLKYKNEIRELSKNEFRILEVLLKNIGKVVSREELMNKLWQSDVYIDDNTLTVNVSRLKAILKEIGIENFIETKRGAGYYINE